MEKYEKCITLFKDNWGMRTAGDLWDLFFEEKVKKYCRIAHIEERKDLSEKRRALDKQY